MTLLRPKIAVLPGPAENWNCKSWESKLTSQIRIFGPAYDINIWQEIFREERTRTGSLDSPNEEELLSLEYENIGCLALRISKVISSIIINQALISVSFRNRKCKTTKQILSKSPLLRGAHINNKLCVLGAYIYGKCNNKLFLWAILYTAP